MTKPPKAIPSQSGEVLLPCPFCGGKAEIEPRNWAGRDFIGVFCTECLIFQDSRCPNDADAIATWNTRATPPQSADGLRERAISNVNERFPDWKPSPAMLGYARAVVAEALALQSLPHTDVQSANMEKIVEYAIDAWHDRSAELHDWLGWTFEEYAAWVADTSAIPRIPMHYGFLATHSNTDVQEAIERCAKVAEEAEFGVRPFSHAEARGRSEARETIAAAIRSLAKQGG